MTPPRTTDALTVDDVDRAVGLHRIRRDILRGLAAERGDGVDRVLDAALAEVGGYCGVDRAYVFRFRDDLAFTDNTHEWCAPGITPEIDNLQNLPGDVVRTWIDAFGRDDFVFVGSVAAIADAERDLRDLLTTQGIQSLLVAPLRGGGELIGFIGFDYVRAPSELSWIDVDVLRAIADTVAAALYRRDSEAIMRTAHRRDPLTGLANEAEFRDLLAERIEGIRAGRDRECASLPAGHRGLTVAITDIDRMADVNIVHGVAAGDAVIRELAHRFADHVGPCDAVARFGSDEFALLFDGDRRIDTADACADRIAALLRVPVEHEGREIRVASSVGVYAAGAAPGDVSEVLAAAQAARAEAKRRGGDSVVCFDADVGERVDRRRQLAEALRRPDATTHLSVVYQPVVDLASGRIVGAEALARWSAADTGVVPPVEFIALAEEIGRIAPLTEHIVRTALDDLARRYRPLDREFGLSINLSPVHLAEPGTVELLDALVTEAGVERRALWFEMTETAVSGPDAVVGGLESLRACGLDVAADDFGTGYSSFARLRLLPFTGIKIDRSFVHGIARDEVARSLVAAQVDIARALGLVVLAEGIEHDEDRAAVLALGIPIGQGYGLHRPMPADQLVALLAAR